jgi:hypothetical protein
MSYIDNCGSMSPFVPKSNWQRGCNDAKAGRDRTIPRGHDTSYDNGYEWGKRRAGGYPVTMRDGSTRTFGRDEVRVVRDCFFTWREGNLIYLAAGDDGNWYEMGCFHDAVVIDIIPALKAAVADKDFRALNVSA